MGQLVGYGVSGTDYDFYLYDSQGRVWSGSSWVAWDDADYLDYRVPAVESSPGRFAADVPSGAEGGLAWVEMRFRGGSLAASYVVWTVEDCCTTSTSDSGDDSGQTLDGIAAEIAATAAGPQSMQVDGQQVVAQPIPHLIEADKYLARKGLNRRRGFWGQVSIAVAVPPGAAGNDT